MGLLCGQVLFFSCGKPNERKSLEFKSQILQKLNSKDLDSALELIEQQWVDGPNEAELVYLKAQVYAMKGGVDVYSLFPILKMKLFEFAVTEWGALEKFSKNQAENVVDMINGENPSGMSVEEIKKRIKEVQSMDVSEITYELNILHLVDSSDHLNNSMDNMYGYYCSYNLEVSSNIPGKIPLKPLVMSKAESKNSKTESCTLVYQRMIAHLDETELKFEIKYRFLDKMHYYLDKLEARKTTERYFKVIMALYESLPVLKKLPTKSETRTTDLVIAMDLLSKLVSQLPLDHELYLKSQQQLGMLSGFILLSSVKDSFDLNKIQGPTDFVCALKAQKVLDLYKDFLIGLTYFMKAMERTSLAKKNQVNYDKFLEILNAWPEELTDEQRENFILGAQNLINDRCF